MMAAAILSAAPPQAFSLPKVIEVMALDSGVQLLDPKLKIVRREAEDVWSHCRDGDCKSSRGHSALTDCDNAITMEMDFEKAVCKPVQIPKVSF